MKYLIKKIYLILLLITILLFDVTTFAKDNKIKYSKENISNYFSGIVFASLDHTDEAFKHLNKVKYLKDSHSNFNEQFIRTLVLLGKFEKAFSFSKEVWAEDKYFFEADLLLGLQSLINEDYILAKRHFDRLNTIPQYNFFLEDFFGNALLSWNEASKNNMTDSFKFLEKIPSRYETLKKIQNSFLHCYFDTPDAQTTFEKLIEGEESRFSRYNFFLVNYLLSKNKKEEAKNAIDLITKLYSSNILIKQTENFILKKQNGEIIKFFNCKNPKDVLAEIFYVMGNLYSTDKNYQVSNFYLKISLFLNNKFTPNKTLLAENLFYQKKYKLSKKIYNSIKSIGPIYSWYASRSIASILLETEGQEYSTSNLESELKLLSSPNFENYYQLANFFKDNKYYEKSIKYYSLALKNITENHSLIPKIFDRRGTSYERIGDWDKAEKDLLESLRLIPDQPHVLNYLAYSWVEKKININRALEMLKKANRLKENDGYIIDSLGWAYYMNENYILAEKFLRKAVEILPSDPIINDHYADTLWMLNKNIQARYFWNHVLASNEIEQELKDNVSKKLIFGIKKKL